MRFIPPAVVQWVRATSIRRQARQLALARGAEAAPVRTLENCRYCGRLQTEHWKIGTVFVTHPGPFERNEYDLLQCVDCEVVYLTPLPAAADLATLYEGSNQFTDRHYSDPAQGAGILNHYRHRLTALRLIPRPGDDCLEVGAGLAWVSRVIKEQVPEARTWAQDVSEECADRCAWVDRYRVGALEFMRDLPAFAFISLTHVIEHVPNPNHLLNGLAERLKPGGRIFLSAPFRPPLWHIGEGIAPWRDYSYLHVPAHISYLSRTWMKSSAAQAGLELERWAQDHDGHQALEAVLLKR